MHTCIVLEEGHLAKYFRFSFLSSLDWSNKLIIIPFWGYWMWIIPLVFQIMFTMTVLANRPNLVIWASNILSKFTEDCVGAQMRAKASLILKKAFMFSFLNIQNENHWPMWFHYAQHKNRSQRWRFIDFGQVWQELI